MSAESSPRTRMSADCEATKNSASRRIRMTGSGQRQEEAITMIMGGDSVKTTTLIGFWNVSTMYEQGKMAQVIVETKRYKLDILGVSESGWTRSGIMKTSLRRDDALLRERRWSTL